TIKSAAMRPMEPHRPASATIHAVRFGIGFLGDSNSRDVLDWARQLERHEHLDRLWVADEQFLRDPWVQLGAIAAVTSRVSIGSFAQGRGLAYALKTIREAEADRGADLPPLRRAAWIYVSVSEDEAAAQRGAGRGLALALRSSHALLKEIGYEIPAEVLDFVL